MTGEIFNVKKISMFVSSDCSDTPIKPENLPIKDDVFCVLSTEVIDRILSYVFLNDRLLNVPLVSKYIHEINQTAPVDATTNKVLNIICLLTPKLKTDLACMKHVQKNLFAVQECVYYFRKHLPELLKYRNGSMKVQFMNIFWELLRVTARCRESLDALDLPVKEEIIKFLIDLWQQNRYHNLFIPDMLYFPPRQNDWKSTIDGLFLSPGMVFPFMYSYLLDTKLCSDNLIADINMNDSNFSMIYLVFGFLDFITHLDTGAEEVMILYEALKSWFLKIASQNVFIAASCFEYMKKSIQNSCSYLPPSMGNALLVQQNLFIQNMPIFKRQELDACNENRLKDLNQCLTVKKENFSMMKAKLLCANEFNLHALIEHFNKCFYTPTEHYEIIIHILFDDKDELKQTYSKNFSYDDSTQMAELISCFGKRVQHSNIFTMFQENSFEKCLFLLSFLKMNVNLLIQEEYTWKKIAWIITNDVAVQTKCFEYVRNLPFRNMLVREVCSWRIFEILSLNTIPDILLKKLVEFNNKKEFKKEFFDYLALYAPTLFLLQMIYHIEVFSLEDQKEIRIRLLLHQSPEWLACGLKDFLIHLSHRCNASTPSIDLEREKAQKCIEKVFNYNYFSEEDGKHFKQYILYNLQGFSDDDKSIKIAGFLKPLQKFIEENFTTRSRGKDYRITGGGDLFP